MMCTRRSLFGACVLALAGAGLTTGSASAQPASGFYLSQEIGLNVAPPVAAPQPQPAQLQSPGHALDASAERWRASQSIIGRVEPEKEASSR